MSIFLGQKIENMKMGNIQVANAYLGETKVWPEASAFTGLTFTAQEANSTIQLNKIGNPTAVNLETSTDGDTWSDYTFGNTITLANIGDKVYMRNKSETDTRFSNDGLNCYRFAMTGKIGASGDVTSLLNKNGTTTLIYNCFESIFQGCTSLTMAPELPATTLDDFCYSAMFLGCTSLTTAPELPATTLAPYCYYGMFNGCTSLTAAPELPVDTLASGCYASMFVRCTNLTTAPELPATTLVDDCYGRMFAECTSLTATPELPVDTLANSCYSGMFDGCTSLTTAPELPATTLAGHCYQWMFRGCTNLTTPPELPATALVDGCYYEMFNGCTKIKVSETQTGEYQIPYRIPTTGTGIDATQALEDVFIGTGGTFTGTPTINTTYYLWNQDVEEISTINNSIGSTPARTLTVDFFMAPYTGNYHITGVVEGSTSGGSIDLRVDGGTEVSGKILINTDDDRVSPDSYSVVPYDCVIHVTQGTTVTLNTRVRSAGGGGGNNFKAFYIG